MFSQNPYLLVISMLELSVVCKIKILIKRLGHVFKERLERLKKNEIL